MKTPLFLLGFTIAACIPAGAQNSDLGVLVGVSQLKSQNTVGAGSVSSTDDVAAQVDYAIQFRQTPVGNFYIELPLAVVVHDSAIVASTITNSTRDLIFFTPGVRWKLWVESRVSFYAALGGGLASFGASTNVVGRTISSTGTRSTHPALDFGGGIDFRVTRLISLRCEGRDYVTSSDAGGFKGSNHAAVYAGIGFHF